MKNFGVGPRSLNPPSKSRTAVASSHARYLRRSLLRRSERSAEFVDLLIAIENFSELETVYGCEVASRSAGRVSDVLMAQGAMVTQHPAGRLHARVPCRGLSTEGVLEKLYHQLFGLTTSSSVQALVVVRISTPAEWTQTGEAHCSRGNGTSEKKASWRSKASYESDMAIAWAFVSNFLRGQCEIHFEPVAKLSSVDEVLYYEGLLRVGVADGQETHGPGSAILALERLGLIRALDALVVGRVIEFLRVNSSLRLGCNISAHSAVLDPWWHTLIRSLREAPSVANRLVIEITESGPIENMEAALNFVRSMRALGCCVALDDFGVEYPRESFALVARPNIIKIDKALLHAARASDYERLQLELLIDRCSALAPVVVVEGVECDRDQALLRDVGREMWCQGYYLRDRLSCPPPIPIRRK